MSALQERVRCKFVSPVVSPTGNGLKVELDVPKGRSVLNARDDGKGFSEGLNAKGMGLRNMEYRANVIGAELTIGRREAGGTQGRCT